MSQGAPESWGIYVHVPWCSRRCPYCAFYVEVDRGQDQRPYLGALIREHTARLPEFSPLGSPATLFFGGGTPSRLQPELIAELIEVLRPAPGAEISLEANPEDLDPRRLAALREAGITRLSVGLQTLNPAFARLLNRNSTVHQARASLARVAEAGFSSFSVDLMFALPGQSLADVELELDALQEIDPPHVALYGLTYEPGTPFTRARERGTFREIDDETWREMYELIAERLRDHGLRRYEISNYARPGHESRHNQLYWTDRPYLGLGPSAHSYGPSGERWHNIADLEAYTRAADPTQARERPTPTEAATDRLLSGLRSSQGLSLASVEVHGVRLDRAEVSRLRAAGLLEPGPDRLILTDSGVGVADAIAAHLSAAVSIDAPTR